MRRRTEAAVAELAVKGVALLLALAAVYYAVAWPWMVGSHRSVLFAWALEIAYLLLVGDIVQFAARGRRSQRAEALRAQAALDQTHREHAANERAARAQAVHRQAERAQATREQAERDRATRREFSAVRPEGKYFTHGACNVKHRTAPTARQCRRG